MFNNSSKDTEAYRWKQETGLERVPSGLEVYIPYTRQKAFKLDHSMC
jgi:hypothetical protein